MSLDPEKLVDVRARVQRTLSHGSAGDYKDVQTILDALIASEAEVSKWEEVAGNLGQALRDEVEVRRDAEAEAERLADKADKFMWQVRDTCARAEKAEAKLTALRAQAGQMFATLLDIAENAEDFHVRGQAGYTLAFIQPQTKA